MHARTHALTHTPARADNHLQALITNYSIICPMINIWITYFNFRKLNILPRECINVFLKILTINSINRLTSVTEAHCVFCDVGMFEMLFGCSISWFNELVSHKTNLEVQRTFISFYQQFQCKFLCNTFSAYETTRTQETHALDHPANLFEQEHVPLLGQIWLFSL
jgi:hypothetical protein